MSNTYCPLPWMHLASHPNGMVSLCCQADHTNFTGFSHSEYPHFTKHWNLNQDEIIVIHNSDSFKQVRLDMLNNKKPVACSKCYKVEDNGGKSKRQEELQNWPTYNEQWAIANTSDTGIIKTDLAYIELRLGNVCNLKCITCNPISSNQWQEDYDKISAKIQWVDQGMHSKNLSNNKTNDWSTNKRFWSDLLESSYWARKIYINGGEPTHNAEHIWYLEQLAERDLAKDITLWYSTNMTHIPKKLLAAWKHFKRIEISASIDALNERNEYIRFPSKWDKTIAVLKEFESMPNVDLTVVQTISALNFAYLDEFAEWIQTTNRKWSINHVTEPYYLSVNAIPLDKRLALLSEYKEVLPLHIYNNLMTRYSGEAAPPKQKLLEFVTELDTIRNTNIYTVLPELMELLK